MKNRNAFLIALVILIAVGLAACDTISKGLSEISERLSEFTGGGDTQAVAEGDGDGGSGGNGASSAYDQLIAYKSDPEAALALSGVQPKEYPSRESIAKALPVESKKLKEMKIGWAAASLGGEFFTGMRDAGFARAKERGMALPDFQGADFSLETQQQQVDTFIEDKIDLLILNPVDPSGGTQMIQKAVGARIPVLVIGMADAKPDYQMVTSIIPSSNEAGYQVGLYCAEELYSKGKVLNVGMVVSRLDDVGGNSRPCGWLAGYLYRAAEMDGNPYASKYDAMLEAVGFWKEFKSARKLDLGEKGLYLSQLGIGEGEGAGADDGQTATAGILEAEPDMALLVVETESMVAEALAEIKAQGKKPGQDMRVVACAGGALASLNYIRGGELMATATDIPLVYSVAMIDMAYNMFDGTGTDRTQAEWCRYYNNMPAVSFIPTMAISRVNVEKHFPAKVKDPVYGKYATFDPWTSINIPGYNELHAND